MWLKHRDDASLWPSLPGRGDGGLQFRRVMTIVFNYQNRTVVYFELANFCESTSYTFKNTQAVNDFTDV